VPRVKDKEGKVFNLTDEQVAQALKSGQWWGFKEPPKVVMRNPGGGQDELDFSPAQVSQALTQGYSFETP
jgi:hypothetical protein